MSHLPQNNLKILKDASSILDNLLKGLIKLRHSLHSEPELGWQEYETTDKIINFLKKYNYQQFNKPLETGLIVDYHPNKNLPLIGFRADIDALPIQDEKNVTYSSKNKGVCHACGHDFHITIACGLAALLKKLDYTFLNNNVRFIFQPAEEPIPSGASQLIKTDVLKNITEMWAMHLEPNLPLNTISLTSGFVNYQTIRLSWKIYGKGGHSARPNLTVNPIKSSIKIIQKTEDYFNTQFSSQDNEIIFAFTQLHCGTSFNVISDNGLITATLRLTKKKMLDPILDHIKEINQSIVKEDGVRIKFESIPGAPPVNNNAQIIERFKKNIALYNPVNFKIKTDFRSTGGDDFGWYSDSFSSALIRFGISKNKETVGLHEGRFDAPDEIIKTAILFFLIQLILLKEIV
jgi:amidohydrolase